MRIPLIANATWPVPFFDTRTRRVYHSESCEPGMTCVCSLDDATADSIVLPLEDQEYFA